MSARRAAMAVSESFTVTEFARFQRSSGSIDFSAPMTT
jgi:hypothetical protein